MKRYLGIVSISYSLLILYELITNKINNFLTPQLQIYLKISVLPLFIIGIVLILKNKDKFKISSLILLLPFIMILFVGDGILTSSFASNRMTNFKINKEEVKDNKEKEEIKEETKIEDIDMSNIDVEVIDSNYTVLANYITFEEKSSNFNGQTIKLRGFVVKNVDYIEEGYFAIGKYEITCCAADAGFVGFIGEYDTSKLKENSWYEIEGVIEKNNLGNGIKSTIKVINIKEIKKEEQYVYPCYSYSDNCESMLKYNLEY